ncbi:hypothetical protein F0562_015609 [Nyssa sinensis]|uniref:Protein kinase domain-containing protein n=1 Tax=Nyssa sinensis TaxID=561372 RepID=A0A5J4ZHV1_9ASTE|nr:hypothetical protein F0562_015609 [Nyssa sinensis]
MTGKKPTDPMYKDGLYHHSFAWMTLLGIILLEVLTGKRPILENDLNRHDFAKKALPNLVIEIVDPILLKDIEEESAMECLISVVKIGVTCSMESPQDRHDIREIIQELNLIRDILQGTRKRQTRKRPLLNLRMTWLPSFEKSNCQEKPKSHSQMEPWLPNFENSYCQDESESYSQESKSRNQEESESNSQEEQWLPNFEKSYSQEELRLANFENLYISSNGQGTHSQTQKLFPNPFPLPPKPISWEDPCWISFEESCSQEEPKSYSQGEPWLPNFENSNSKEEPWLCKFEKPFISSDGQGTPSKYGLGSEVSTKGDIYSYGILLLEMLTGKKPTERMFEDGLDHHSFAEVALPGIVLLEVLTGKRPILEDDLDLHNFARKALPNRVMEIVDPILLKDIKEDSLVGCLISMVRIGVACSMESPQDRMEIRKVIRQLKLIREILQGTQKRPTRKRPMLNLRMTWLPSFEKSYCQDEPNSYSQGESCLPGVENSYSQGESGLPNFEESYSQGELRLSNFEKSYISSNGQETLSQTQNLFPNPVPSLPKPIQYKGPGWESFEECYCQDKPKSDNQGETWLPNFENCFNQEESWLPNSGNSFSQEESWLPNFEKSYISSGQQGTPFPTQKLFPNFVPLLPKPVPLLPWEGPGWISFEESYHQEKPKSDS